MAGIVRNGARSPQSAKIWHCSGASLKRIPALKQLIPQASREAASRAGLAGKAGCCDDGTFGQDALNAITGEGWWIGRPY